jgi:hypothetical protein
MLVVLYLLYSQFLPRAHAQGGIVIGLVVVVVVVVVTPKIGISRDLGTRATRKHNESIRFDEKLASVCFKSKPHLSTVPTRCIMHAGHVLSAHAHN